MNYVYILFSKKLGKFYIGRTKNLSSRFKDHNNAKSKFTSSGIPWILVYYSAFIENKDAVNEEKFLKSGQGRERRKYLLREFLAVNNIASKQ